MIRTVRTLIMACALVGLFSLSSCNRLSDRFCDPCGDACQVGYNTPSYPCPCDEGECFAPCGSDFYPCGSGKCGSVNNCEQPFPEEVCYRNMRTYNTCDDCVVSICQRAPEFATVGAPYPIEIQIKAIKECAFVTVHQTLPCDAAFVRSEPPVEPNGNEVSWTFDHMVEGETQNICVWVKPEREGCCLAAATVCACPQLCAYTKCGQPVICIEKCGPACGCIGCEVPYTITVCNSGSAIAYDVVVTDNIPDGMIHETRRNCLRYELGTMCPGDSKRVCLTLCPTKTGMMCNTATVTYCGGPKCSAEACTMINEPCVEVTKTGPDWAYICKTVDYTITVTNPGELILRDVVVDDISANGTTIVAAPGAEICCNRAVWTLCELCPGETKTFTLSVRSQMPGRLTNRVNVTTQSCCGPCTECAEATTEWRGIPAVHMCMVDTTDPICIGETTVYRICVTNRGSAEDTNVQLKVSFTNQLKPQSANGPSEGTISGNTVTFAPIKKMMPKQSVEYCITVKGVSAGDARGEASLKSDNLSSPVTDTESTHVY